MHFVTMMKNWTPFGYILGAHVLHCFTFSHKCADVLFPSRPVLFFRFHNANPVICIQRHLTCPPCPLSPLSIVCAEPAKPAMPSNILHTSLVFPIILTNHLPTVARLHHALMIPLVLHQLSVSAGPADLIQRNDYWLPDNVVPVNYNLRLMVNMEEFTSEGKVKIRVEVLKATDQITLHAEQYRGILTVLKNQVKVYHNAKKITIKGQDYDPRRMFYTIKLRKRVRKGTKLTLVMPFKGRIQNGGEGFYSSPDGGGGQLAVTQFESMLARTAFPCFDEPRITLPPNQSQTKIQIIYCSCHGDLLSATITMFLVIQMSHWLKQSELQ